MAVNAATVHEESMQQSLEENEVEKMRQMNTVTACQCLTMCLKKINKYSTRDTEVFSATAMDADEDGDEEDVC